MKLRLLVPVILLAILCAWKFAEADGALDCPWPSKCDPTDIKEVGVVSNDSDRHFAQVYWNLRSKATDMVTPNRLAAFFIRGYDAADSNGWLHTTNSVNSDIFWPPWETPVEFAKTNHALFEMEYYKQGMGQNSGVMQMRSYCAAPGDCVAIGLEHQNYALSPAGGTEGSQAMRLDWHDYVPFMPTGSLTTALSVDDTSVEIQMASPLWLKFIGETNYMVFMDATNEYDLDGPGGTDGILSVDFGHGNGQLEGTGKAGIWQVAEASDLPADLDIDNSPGDWFTQYCFAHERSGYSTTVKGVYPTYVLEWLPIIRGPGDADCDGDGVDEDDCAADEFATVYPRQGDIIGAPQHYIKNEWSEEADWGNGDATIRPCIQMSDFTFDVSDDGNPVSGNTTFNLTTSAKYTMATGVSEFYVHTGGPPFVGWGIKLLSDQRRASHPLVDLIVQNIEGDLRRQENVINIRGSGDPPTNSNNHINFAINVSEASVGYRFKHRTAAVAENHLPIVITPQGWDTSNGDLYRVLGFHAKDAELFFDSENSDGSLQAWRIQTEDNTAAQVIPAAPHASVMGDMMVWFANPNTDTGDQVCAQWHLDCSDVLDAGFDSTTETCSSASATDAIALCRGHAQ